MPNHFPGTFQKIPAIRIQALRTLILVFLTIIPVLNARAEGTQEPLKPNQMSKEYDKVRQDYVAGRTAEAYQRLESIAQRGPGSPTIDYALGTSAARLGKSGEALAALERSLIQESRNRDARANFQLVQDGLPATARTNDAYHQRWYGWISPAEAFMAFAFTYIAGWSMLAVGILNRGPDRQPGMLRGSSSLLGVSVLLLIFFAVTRSQALGGAYVVGSSPVTVLSGPGASFKKVLELPPGSRVRLAQVEVDAGHRPIRLSDGSTGYIPEDRLATVTLP